ncbi:hypothetical protein JQ543_23485 [Bradyrhizobium diazoefficiens]|nr:hypothetical protein [Bradyrhizobium diazoefficiens]MBR0850724.1 hypothetical protein [Bradyrhizobium diazoefficiens]
MPNAEIRKSVTLSREELHALVWATPMSRLAAQHGLSGTGLAKICRRLDVPYPPRGYWARREAGKKVAQAALPAIRPGTRAQVTIAPSLPASPPPQMPSELKDGLAAARRLTAGLRVPSKLHHPHQVVAGWIEERQRSRDQAKAHSWGRGDYVPPDFTAMERRRHRLLSTLFIALEKHGYAAKVDERGRPAVEIARQPSTLIIKEKYRQVRQPLTEEEKKRGFNPKRPWRQEMQPTGLLQLSVEPRLHPTLRQSWIDAEDQPLEQQLPEIAATFVAAAPILQERRRQQEENERRRHEEEMRSYEERQRQQLERNRLRGFLELASRWRQVEDARQFLNALASHTAQEPAQAVGDLSLDEWIAWARERLTGRDPLEAGQMSSLHYARPPGRACATTAFLKLSHRGYRFSSFPASRRQKPPGSIVVTRT